VLPPRLNDRRLLRLMDRVTPEVSPAFDAAFPGKTTAEVSITMVDGSVYHSGPVEAIWEPPGTLPSDEALEEKFRWLTSPLIGEENAAALARLIWEFDQCPSLDALLNRCVPDRCPTDGGDP
jgi:2-methylcitrate dehydratase PrpD